MKTYIHYPLFRFLMGLTPKEWPMPLFPEPYEATAAMEKTIEGRVPDFEKPEKDYRTMKAGDTIKFYAVNPATRKPLENLPELHFKVTFVHRYDTIEAMLEAEGLEKLVPGIPSVEEGAEVYLGFPGYPERVKKYGIYAIGLAPLGKFF